MVITPVDARDRSIDRCERRCKLPREIFEKDFWHFDPLPSFRHVETGMMSHDAFAGGIIPTEAAPFVEIRALHPPTKQEPGVGILSVLRNLFRG
jgi:hypothetical protein